MLELAGQIFTGLVIAGASAWITVWLARKKFRAERLWEKKVAAYERVIDALHQSKRFAAEHVRAAEQGQEVSEERDQELRAMSKGAHNEILRATDVGRFIMSASAVEVLQKYEQQSKELSACQSWFEYIDLDYTITKQCLESFLDEAKKDVSA